MIGKKEKVTYYVIAGYFGYSGYKYWNSKKRYWMNFVEQATKYDYDVIARKHCFEPAKYQPDYRSNTGVEIRKVQRLIETIDEWED